MQAAVRNGLIDQKIEIKEVIPPTPLPNQALVTIKASSVNRGELSLLKVRDDGWRPGQDFAGIVTKSATDGSGPAVGARVVGLAEGGAWSEMLAVETDKLTILPNNVSFKEAAALPLAGLTALRTLRLAGDIVGRPLLITSGGGGVGFYQLQLAALAGARVSAIVRHEALRATLQKELPATTFVSSLNALEGPFNVVLDSVGGSLLHETIHLLTPNSTLISFGNSSGESTPFSLFDFMPGHENTKILTYFSYHTPAPIVDDLALLLSLVASKKLRLFESHAVPLIELAQGLETFSKRKIAGKLIVVM